MFEKAGAELYTLHDNPNMLSENPGVREKTITRKFGAKASFEVWSIAFYVIFREESEFEVKNGPELLKSMFLFFKNRKNKKSKIRKIENFLKIHFFKKIMEGTFLFAKTGKSTQPSFLRDATAAGS